MIRKGNTLISWDLKNCIFIGSRLLFCGKFGQRGATPSLFTSWISEKHTVTKKTLSAKLDAIWIDLILQISLVSTNELLRIKCIWIYTKWDIYDGESEHRAWQQSAFLNWAELSKLASCAGVTASGVPVQCEPVGHGYGRMQCHVMRLPRLAAPAPCVHLHSLQFVLFVLF